MEYFDYEEAAREAGLSADALRKIVDGARREFPADDMMFELHVLRTCMAIRQGWVTVQQTVAAEAATRT